jgi:hypothetical protein
VTGLRAAVGNARPEVRLGLVAGVVAIAWALLVLDPLGPATIDPDASSSVLYFDRIVSGQRLEAFVPTTPKPLLTFEYGLAWIGTQDWRWLVWLTILVAGVAVGSTAVLVSRLAAARLWDGNAAGLAAAAFVTAALLGSSDLMLEVSRANSLVWALAGWSIAGLAITEAPMRPRLAGVALLLAGLVRFETLAIDAVALAAVGLVAWRCRQLSLRDPAVVGVAIAFGALPIAMLHDWLLSGDPFYWLAVPARYTAIFNPGLAPIDPIAYAGVLGGRLAAQWPLVALGALGVYALVRLREWLALAGIAALGLGVAALLVWLAWRGLYISNRYYEPIDLALIVLAAIGIGRPAGMVVGSLRQEHRRVIAVAAAGLAIAAGVAVTWPALPWDRRAATELSDVRRASAHAEALMPDLRGILAAGVTELLVPSRDVSRVAVETGEPLTRVLNSYAVLLDGGVEALTPGQVVFHDAAADRPAALYRPLEIDNRAMVGGNTIVRLDPRAPEIWLLSVQ